MASGYTEASIKTLSSTEHIRLRPGMYIGRLGNGAHAEDGIYVLLKETIDNSVDEFTMGHGKKIEVELGERRAKVRDYGRGIPLGKLLECVSVINTGAKYDSETFKKAVGLNGVGQKAVNALSHKYRASAFREGKCKVVDFVLFHYGTWSFPAFNVADSCITVGAACVIVDSLYSRAGAAAPAAKET